jgi:hypothetical protein
MPDAKTAGNAWDHCRHVARPCLRGLGRNAFVVSDASRDEDATRSEQDVDEANLLRFGHAPRMDVLATDSVGVVLLTLEHRDVCAAASQNQGERRTGNSSTDDRDIALYRHGSTSHVARRNIEIYLELRYLIAWVCISGSGIALNRFRRLKIRYEHRADIHLAFLQLGCALISLRFLG